MTLGLLDGMHYYNLTVMLSYNHKVIEVNPCLSIIFFSLKCAMSNAQNITLGSSLTHPLLGDFSSVGGVYGVDAVLILYHLTRVHLPLRPSILIVRSMYLSWPTYCPLRPLRTRALKKQNGLASFCHAT